MFSVLPVVLPIFALILTGWGARRLRVLGAHATQELNRFVVYLALPALLFDIVAHANWSEIWQPGFIAAFGLGAGTVFVCAVALAIKRDQPLPDAAIEGLNAAYANTGFVGFPLALAVFGSTALAPTLIATILTVCVLFAIALILIELGMQTERGLWPMLRKLGVSLGRNPLLIAPAAGALFLASGLEVPAPAHTFLKLLGGAASPCALVALGLFLGERREAKRVGSRACLTLTGLKLLVQPALTWVLAVHVFHLTPQLTQVAVLLAALPTGTGPFMVAEFYRREAGLTSRVILTSTVLSLVTITVYLS